MPSDESRVKLPDALDAPPVEPSAALRRRVLASVSGPSRLEGFVARFAGLFDVPEARAREILAAVGSVAGGAWVEAPIPGVRLFHFPGGERVAEADCGLVHLAPGTVFPAHRHLGVEWTFVLAGSAEEDGGEIWRPGDVVVRETATTHGFRAIGDEPYVFAVVLHGGIEIAEP